MIQKIFEKLSQIDYNSLFDGFARYDYIILQGDKMYLNGKEIQPITGVTDDSVYCIDNNLFAVWNMDKNYPYWDIDDIVAGIVHEMFHCFQIDNNWKHTYSENVFNYNLLDILINNSYDILYKHLKKDFLYGVEKKYIEDLLIIQNIEGTALWVEFMYKKIYCNKNISTLFENYLNYIHTSKKKYLINYFIGGYRRFREYEQKE